jgi:hypothetical protein
LPGNRTAINQLDQRSIGPPANQAHNPDRSGLSGSQIMTDLVAGQPKPSDQQSRQPAGPVANQPDQQPVNPLSCTTPVSCLLGLLR